MAEFVTKMATTPIQKHDDYNNNWHIKYGATTSRFWGGADQSMAGSSI